MLKKPRLGLASAPGNTAEDIPGAEVLEGAAPLVVALHPARLAVTRRRQLAPPGLNGGLLVGRDDLVAQNEGKALPEPP
jgi:hypothetical protein